jgi:transcriptional regulator GlxA family with amidase domain
MLLAAAGLLDGRRPTTHWNHFSRLSELAPRARVDCDAIYVRDGDIFTSADGTAGMGLALGMVEADDVYDWMKLGVRSRVMGRCASSRWRSAADSAATAATARVSSWRRRHARAVPRVSRGV